MILLIALLQRGISEAPLPPAVATSRAFTPPASWCSPGHRRWPTMSPHIRRWRSRSFSLVHPTRSSSTRRRSWPYVLCWRCCPIGWHFALLQRGDWRGIYRCAARHRAAWPLILAGPGRGVSRDVVDRGDGPERVPQCGMLGGFTLLLQHRPIRAGACSAHSASSRIWRSWRRSCSSPAVGGAPPPPLPV